MYRLVFTQFELDVRRYEMCYQAFALTDMQIPSSRWDEVIELSKQLKSIGVETKKEVNGVMLLDLQPGGGEITLERSALKLLKEMIERPIWRPLVIVDAKAVKEWLDSLEPEANDAKPEAKRRASATAKVADG